MKATPTVKPVAPDFRVRIRKRSYTTCLGVLLVALSLNGCKEPEVIPQNLRRQGTANYMLPEVVVTGSSDQPYDPSIYGSGSGGGAGGSSGSGAGGGAGGGAGSSNSPSSSSSTVLVIISGSKVNPAQEVRCFNTSLGAALTVYVQQGKPGTREPVGPNQVGHTFIGIEQNGVTRYLGYYPEASAGSIGLAVGRSYAGEIHDNSGSPYNVSISCAITSTQLSSIIDYVKSYPSTYNLNTYNCTDFGIKVGNLGGLNLPATASSGIFSGRSPGNLGEDIRSMSTPPNGVINKNGGNVPTKQGTCP